MLSYARVPLLFLFAGSLLGVFLRWQFISPTPGVNYTFFLHGHSHIMFLGWIFNAIYIAVCNSHIAERDVGFFRKLFIFLQLMVVGMLISFPLQGYGFYSILFSTLHTCGAFLFIFQFFRKTKSDTSVSVWFARIAGLFFVISAAGPFALGYLMANGAGQSNAYYFAIYFYLHFQYNGFFLFGIFSLVFDLLDEKGIKFDRRNAMALGWVLAATCLPSYLLSVLWAQPGVLINGIAGLAAIIQLLALLKITSLMKECAGGIKTNFSRPSQILLLVALIAFVAKLLLQVASALPEVAQLAYQLRPVVIAYLHMVLIGIVSTVLLVWYFEFRPFKRLSTATVSLFITSFVGMEICLSASPWWTDLFGANSFGSTPAILGFSVGLSCSFLLFLLLSARK